MGLINNDKISFTIYAIIVSAAVFAEFITYDENQVPHSDYFSSVVGLVGWFGIFIQSQKIIDNNQFRQFTSVGLTILAISIIKQLMTSYNQLPLFAAGLPLLFVGFFRLLTYLFYKDYPNIIKKPIIIFASKIGQVDYDGKDQGYIPTMREKVFSLLLLMGFMGFAFGLLILLKQITS